MHLKLALTPGLELKLHLHLLLHPYISPNSSEPAPAPSHSPVPVSAFASASACITASSIAPALELALAAAPDLNLALASAHASAHAYLHLYLHQTPSHSPVLLLQLYQHFSLHLHPHIPPPVSIYALQHAPANGPILFFLPPFCTWIVPGATCTVFRGTEVACSAAIFAIARPPSWGSLGTRGKWIFTKAQNHRFISHFSAQNTKYSLSWLTNRALVYEPNIPKCGVGGSCGVPAKEHSCKQEPK